ncbi:MAG: BrnA antitoxin family protein [Terriglobales bacterium]|jgi:uncharacterized protein (DUF4415 family)
MKGKKRVTRAVAGRAGRGRKASGSGKRKRSTRVGKLHGSGDERWLRGLERAEFEERLAEMRARRRRPPKKRISLSLDADVLAFFKEPGPRFYQRRIGEALRAVMEEQKKQK